MRNQQEKIGLRESFLIVARALRVSIITKGMTSIIVSVLGLAAAFLPMLISLTLKQFTDQIQLLSQVGTMALGDTLTFFMVLAVFYVTQTTYLFIQSYYGELDRLNIFRYIKSTLLRLSCNVKYKYIENYDDFIERVRFTNDETGQRVAKSIQTMIIWFQNLITFISLLYILLNVSVWIVVCILVTSIPAVVLSSMQKDEEYRVKTKWIKEGAWVAHTYLVNSEQDAMNEVRFLGLYPYLKSHWRDLANRYLNVKNQMTRKHVIYNSIADVLRNGVLIGVLLIAVYQIFRNPLIGLGTFTLVLTTTGLMQEVTAKLFVSPADFLSDIPYMRDFFNLEKLEHEAADLDVEPLHDADICFEQAHFTYPGATTQAICDLSVTIRQGEKIAVVGKNGSGKSTFVSLLCGLHTIDSGSALIGGLPISENLSVVRRTISAVFQDFARYEASLRDNITISDQSKKLNEKNFASLMKRVGVHDIANQQKNGFDEIIGTFNEKGNNLSGGEWQKVAIARAAYRVDARIMVLDEPTAALDPLAEAKLYRDFAQLTGDKTTILISHRLGITSVVDRILVFDMGQIVEDGTHNQLMELKGIYAEMYNAQAQWYK